MKTYTVIIRTVHRGRVEVEIEADSLEDAATLANSPSNWKNEDPIETSLDDWHVTRVTEKPS